MDITLISMQLGAVGILFYEYLYVSSYEEHYHEQVRIAFAIDLLPSLLEIIFSLLLVVSACHITSWVRKSTGKK